MKSAALRIRTIQHASVNSMGNADIERRTHECELGLPSSL